MTKRFILLRQTKNYDLYVEQNNEMNKLYLPKTGINELDVTIVEAINSRAPQGNGQ